MPDLIIDGRAVSVPKGTMVIEAAERLGIMIPRFCWHKALGAAGACRMCAVMFTAGPVKGLEMSCMTPAADGMVVETFHPEAVAFRRSIIELLMVNHPHDCPVCDEGGHCLLQDETISGGHSLRRFPGRKRTYLDQNLGPFIQHEMNRCIHCYRCARFYQEYCGYRDFGPMQNANRVYFGRFDDGALENPFAGNLADLCPTGTLTDKPARFVSRRWDCLRAPSVCLHCSLGCNVTALSRYRRVARIEARENAAVNGSFICDRGRFSAGYEAIPERPRSARLDGNAVPAIEAETALAARLAALAEKHGPGSIAILGGLRSTMETQAAGIALAQAAGWRAPAFFATRTEQAATQAALAVLTPPRARSLAEIGKADAVLVLGVSPLFDAPMLALALRQASRAGAKIIVADPRPVALPLPFTHLPVPPRQFPAVLAVATGSPDAAAAAAQKRLPFAPELWPGLETAAKALAAAKRPALVFTPGLAAALPDDDRLGLFPVLAQASSAGAALLAPTDAPGLDELAADVAAGRVKGLVVVEADLFAAAPGLAAVLGKLDLLVVLDYLPTPTVAAAHIVLPTTTIFESGGILAASDGRLQAASPVQSPGDPVARDGAGSHPPRAFDRPLPGTDPAPAAFLLDRLARGLGLTLPREPLAALAAAIPALAGLDLAALPQDGLRPAFAGLAAPLPAPLPLSAESGLAVIYTDALFATDEPGRYAPLAQAQTQAGPPVLLLHADDAAALGLADGLADGLAVSLECGNRLVPATLHLSRAMARGVIVVPRVPDLAGLPPILGPCGLRRR
ncbi:molybdopterin-dependent oxidoreductase [Desulfovibrio aerotolerans]|uniref:Molybdopterin-dependent oxidoreductase n=1 Tax=Solidesulfovibrio aerotolerans TaxID=295255 RepID=A0A7C9N521_9BACT|nr:2Fe-2S iron-sulfur cluster-binding protein [Solidesulfovibrio aerotolerans]MYL82975.1 molybdopterin-dependent oxidoreductase [Solidesulfovibrio aerotolerans]